MTIDFSQINPRYFDRADDSSDAAFYAQPRKVVHIDQCAIDAVTNLYREVLPAGGSILDLMSSWRSHLPTDVNYARVCGLGMNQEEMADNPQLSDWLVHNLNESPTLPFGNAEFDGVCCCVSIQYLQQPLVVFAEVVRVLKRNAPFMVSFSNRCFPTKAINLWRATDDRGHIDVVASYFAAQTTFRDCEQRSILPTNTNEEHRDPLFAVWGFKEGKSDPQDS